jgi:molecular chaperone GrpE
MDLYKVANEDSLKSMITVLDDFDRAQKSVETAVDMEAVKEGLKLVHHKLKSTVTAQGLKEMENTIGSAFNTDLHEAVTNIPAPTEDLKGKVIDELEKGYTLNDKVIRFAKVVVGA